MQLAQVLHSSAWRRLKELGVAAPGEAEAIERHFARAIELRRRADHALAAESYNGLGQFYHMRAKATSDPEEAAVLWAKAEATLQAALAQRRARPLSAELAQSLVALGSLRLDCEAAARCGGPKPTSDAISIPEATSISEATSEAISLLLEAISLYALSLGPFHPRLGYALSCLARAYAISARGGGGVPARSGDGTADGVAGGLADGAHHTHHHTHRFAVLQRLAHIQVLVYLGCYLLPKL